MSKEQLVASVQDWDDSSRSRVILVDDDVVYRDGLAADLEDHGFSVRGFCDGATLSGTLDLVRRADVLLLEWVLPGMSGVDILAHVRQHGVSVPVVFLTGRAQVDYERAAFERGAFDFIDKTRGVEVLAKRLELMIGPPRPIRPSTPPLVYGALALRPESSRAEWRSKDVELTLTEYNVVSLLAAAAGKAITYRAVYDRMHYAGFIAGSGERGHRANVRSMIKRIRRKFLATDAGFAAIGTQARIGYFWLEQA